MKLEKSQVKFAVSDKTGELIGFISHNSKTKVLKGVRESSTYKKKICVLSEHLKGTVKPNILYEVELKEMRQHKGYVVVTAIPILFEAGIETVIKPFSVYQVIISFGSKIIYFDPVNGKSPLSRTKEGVIEVLESRADMKDAPAVITEFAKQADYLLEVMKNDRINTNTAE